MKCYLIAALLVLSTSTTVLAGFDEGAAAYSAKNYEKAWQEFAPLANQGDARAQFALGVMYDFGDGVTKDLQQAAGWYRKAAEQGHTKAQLYLGAMYEHGQGVPQDYQKAMEWWRKSADQGNGSAQFNLCAFYKNGDKVPKNLPLAYSWCEKAAENGVADAQYLLGNAYYAGAGVPEDDNASTKYFERAAAQGHAGAQDSLCRIYYVAKRGEAFSMCRKAAANGEIDSVKTLGWLFEEGKIVRKDYVAAYALQSVHSTKTDDPGRLKGLVARTKMSPKVIKAGSELASQLSIPGNFEKALSDHLKQTLK